MRKITYLFSLLLLCMALTGCAKCINEYDKTVVGTVDNKEYTAAYNFTYMVPVRVGKVTTMQPRIMHHSEKYEITIIVDNMSVIIDNEDLYNQYEIGDSINMNVHYKEYNDGTVKRKASVK